MSCLLSSAATIKVGLRLKSYYRNPYQNLRIEKKMLRQNEPTLYRFPKNKTLRLILKNSLEYLTLKNAVDNPEYKDDFVYVDNVHGVNIAYIKGDEHSQNYIYKKGRSRYVMLDGEEWPVYTFDTYYKSEKKSEEAENPLPKDHNINSTTTRKRVRDKNSDSNNNVKKPRLMENPPQKRSEGILYRFPKAKNSYYVLRNGEKYLRLNNTVENSNYRDSFVYVEKKTVFLRGDVESQNYICGSSRKSHIYINGKKWDLYKKSAHIKYLKKMRPLKPVSGLYHILGEGLSDLQIISTDEKPTEKTYVPHSQMNGRLCVINYKDEIKDQGVSFPEELMSLIEVENGVAFLKQGVKVYGERYLKGFPRFIRAADELFPVAIYSHYKTLPESKCNGRYYINALTAPEMFPAEASNIQSLENSTFHPSSNINHNPNPYPVNPDRNNIEQDSLFPSTKQDRSEGILYRFPKARQAYYVLRDGEEYLRLNNAVGNPNYRDNFVYVERKTVYLRGDEESQNYTCGSSRKNYIHINGKKWFLYKESAHLKHFKKMKSLKPVKALYYVLKGKPGDFKIIGTDEKPPENNYVPPSQNIGKLCVINYKEEIKDQEASFPKELMSLIEVKNGVAFLKQGVKVYGKSKHIGFPRFIHAADELFPVITYNNYKILPKSKCSGRYHINSISAPELVPAANSGDIQSLETIADDVSPRPLLENTIPKLAEAKIATTTPKRMRDENSQGNNNVKKPRLMEKTSRQEPSESILYRFPKARQGYYVLKDGEEYLRLNNAVGNPNYRDNFVYVERKTVYLRGDEESQNYICGSSHKNYIHINGEQWDLYKYSIHAKYLRKMRSLKPVSGLYHILGEGLSDLQIISTDEKPLEENYVPPSDHSNKLCVINYKDEIEDQEVNFPEELMPLIKVRNGVAFLKQGVKVYGESHRKGLPRFIRVGDELFPVATYNHYKTLSESKTSARYYINSLIAPEIFPTGNSHDIQALKSSLNTASDDVSSMLLSENTLQIVSETEIATTTEKTTPDIELTNSIANITPPIINPSKTSFSFFHPHTASKGIPVPHLESSATLGDNIKDVIKEGPAFNRDSSQTSFSFFNSHPTLNVTPTPYLEPLATNPIGENPAFDGDSDYDIDEFFDAKYR